MNRIRSLAGLGVLSTIAFFGMLLPTTSGCVSQFSVESRPCPCAAGYRCCPYQSPSKKPKHTTEEEDESFSSDMPEDGYCVIPSETCDSDTAASTSTASSSGNNGGAFPPHPPRTELSSTTDQPRCVTQDKDRVYWQRADGDIAGRDKTGGGPIRASQLDTKTKELNVKVCGIAVGDDGFLYTTVFGAGAIAKLSLSASGDIGEQSTMLGSLLTPSSLVVDGDLIYVTEYDSGAIKRVSKNAAPSGTGPAAPTIELARGGAKPHHIVADAKFVYWIDEGGLRKMSKDGGNIATLSTSEGVGDLMVARGAPYWRSGASIMTIAPDGEIKSLALDAARLAEPDDSDDSGRVHTFTTDGFAVVIARGSNIEEGRVTGGPMTLLFPYKRSSSLLAANLLSVDDVRVFWTDSEALYGHAKSSQ